MAKSKRFNFVRNFAAKAYEIFNGGTLSGGIFNEIHQPLNAVSLSGARLSADSLFTVWRNHGDVFACVREIKDNIGSQGRTWVNRSDSNKDPNLASVNMAEEILNFGRTFRELDSKISQFAEISGNAYLLILRSDSGRVIGFDVMDPRTVSVVTDEYGNIYKWIQRVKGVSQEYEPGEVLHYKETDDPNSPVFGLSPLEPIIWELRADLSAMMANYAFFANDAQPAAQYILDDTLGQEEKKKAVQLIQDQLKGPENRNKSIVMDGIKEIKTIGFSQKDMEFSLLRKLTTEKICSAFGVPKAILNYTDGVNYSNGENQDKKFWEGTIGPKQLRRESFWNIKVLPAIGINDIKLEYGVKTFEDDQWNEASTRADQQQGVLTLNEVREKRGYSPFDPVIYGEWVDRPLLWNGQAVKPLEDIGIEMADGLPAILNEDQAVKEFAKLGRMANIASRSAGPKVNAKTDKELSRDKLESKIRHELESEFLNREQKIREEMAAKVSAALESIK